MCEEDRFAGARTHDLALRGFAWTPTRTPGGVTGLYTYTQASRHEHAQPSGRARKESEQVQN